MRSSTVVITQPALTVWLLIEQAVVSAPGKAAAKQPTDKPRDARGESEGTGGHARIPILWGNPTASDGSSNGGLLSRTKRLAERRRAKTEGQGQSKLWYSTTARTACLPLLSRSRPENDHLTYPVPTV